MACIKTGARVWLPEYSARVVCDAHAVGDCVVLVHNGIDYMGKFDGCTHSAVLGNVGYKSDIRNVIVIPAIQFKPV